MRLQKYLANCGVASRRKCEDYILEGKVRVNGDIIRTLGTQVEEGDEVTFNDQKVKLEDKFVYYMLNKPVGYVTSMHDEKQRPIVIDLLKETQYRVYPIGRLDYNTSGLLLLTNDGDLTYRLTHPKHEVKKRYEVKVRGTLTKEAQNQLKNGVLLDGRQTAPAGLKILHLGEKSTRFYLTIHEGRNRQVRRMCEAVGYVVLSLKRVSIGKLTLGDLALGDYRLLTKEELQYLKKISL